MNTFIDLMEKHRLIVILRKIPSEELCSILDVLYDSGIRLAEITFDASGKVSDSETASVIRQAVAHTQGRMFIGAGTVLTEDQLQLTKQAGGRFIISPHTDLSLIRRTKEEGLISIPGIMNVSEMVAAAAAGADYVKVFPASVLGPDFIKQVKAPLPHIKMLAVGGVKTEDIPKWQAAGADGFGIGSAIVNRSLCCDKKIAEIRKNAEVFAEICRKRERI